MAIEAPLDLRRPTTLGWTSMSLHLEILTHISLPLLNSLSFFHVACHSAQHYTPLTSRRLGILTTRARNETTAVSPSRATVTPRPPSAYVVPRTDPRPQQQSHCSMES